MEGWEAWDVALRCAGQLRTAQIIILGLDMNAALKIADALGHDASSMVELLPACESGMVLSLNNRLLTKE